MDSHFGRLEVPVLGLSLEQLILILYPAFLIPAVYLWWHHLQRRRTEATRPHGCIKLELKDRSHMTDELDRRYDSGVDDRSQWRVKAIHIHPIKSCAPVELDQVDVEVSGMTWDRKFVFAELLPEHDSPDGPASGRSLWTFRTLRTPGYEKLALVKPEVWVPATTEADAQHLHGIEQTGVLIIRFPHIPAGLLAPLDRLFMRLGLLPQELSFQVPLTPAKDHRYPKETIKLWSDNPAWLNMSVHLPDTFRAYINAKHPIALFRVDPDLESYRKVFRNAPRKEVLGYQSTVGANDAYPIHILNLASVHDVGTKVKDSITQFSARRFRSNLLVAGPPAYDEDDWKTITIGSSDADGRSKTKTHLFHCACRTTRCRLPNVDPESGDRHPIEPDKTLRSFRCIDKGATKKACLGLHLVPADMKAVGGRIQIKVGDLITVTERGEHMIVSN